MKWFKHMTDSHDDEKLAALLAAHGLEGYGFWWMVVALVAKQIPKDGNVPEVSYPVSTWLRLTGVYHHKKFRMFVECMNNLALISATSNQHLANIYALSTKDVLTISIPNILKFRDEYSKKSRHKKESVRSKMEMEMEMEMENKPSSSSEIPPELPVELPVDFAPDVTERMERREFLNLYQATFNVLMPGGLFFECSECIKLYPPEAIREAFRIGAENGARSFRYIKAVLDRKGTETSDDDEIIEGPLEWERRRQREASNAGTTA